MAGIIKCYNNECRDYDLSEADHCSRPLQRIQECSKGKIKKEEEMDWYYKELTGNGCICGGEKKSGKSFCYTCFKALPEEHQKDLYKRLGSGYEQAYDTAVEYLERWVCQ